MNIRKVALLIEGNVIADGEFVVHVDAEYLFDTKRLENVNYDDEGKPYVWDVSEAIIAKGDMRVSGNIDCHAWVLATGDIAACGA